MADFDSSYYGDTWAESYDLGVQADPESAVRCLRDLAGIGPVLELGVGTGRVALPLSANGVEVYGLDSSEKMLEKLRAKPGSGRLHLFVGDMRDFHVDTAFSLAYVPINSLFYLLTQADQVSCFQAVAKHLAAGGRFVVEAFVPNARRWRGDQTIEAKGDGPTSVWIKASVHDPVTQRVSTKRLHASVEGETVMWKLLPTEIRYAWPAELDLMARVAGLVLEHRWADWDKRAFNAQSSDHITVYKAASN